MEKESGRRVDLARAVFEHAPVGLVLLSAGGRIRDVCREAAALLGLPGAELIGRRFDELLVAGDRERLAAHLAAAGLRERPTLEVLTLTGPADRVVRMHTTVLPPDAAEGEFLYHCALVDFTEQQRLEQELDSARREAEEASRAKNRFLANMSHEMRTPLNGILGLLELTLKTELTDVQRENLRMVRDSGRNLLTIINDILDITKIESGMMGLVPELFDLDRVLSTTARMFSIESRAKGLELRYVKSLETPQELYGDPVRLRQVLANLVGNAIKFTESGAVEIEAKPWPCPDDHENRACLLFEVRDTGCGIEKGLQASIFDSFAQADTSFSRRYQGAGLGLAICKRLVDLMGGEIWVESEPGKGSTFFFTAAFELARPAPLAAGTGAALGGIKLPSLRILLAEDNRVNQVFARRALEMEGHQVVCASSGKEALSALTRRGPFDLVLMDIQMPELDGVEATRLIRSDASGAFDPNVPIIALTAYAMKGDRDRFLQAGMNDYISKPFDTADLAEVIGRVMLRP
ncbi:PAS/PAC sensor hybrid histidine kinase [Desulfovibrio sp. X2]|uniref:ATP-binding protein n=1 Tax=Desulfovibrio sp. X2 TaxID=941449 RepID=UPI0003587CE5|nr:ATP-binding protein [Desulfovibrio sp. X2]EPR37528.1 PAS/PAC sensor hybrid histidine kinase [Desulfovibrio sp. X2]